jgi:hypothetical protein
MFRHLQENTVVERRQAKRVPQHALPREADGLRRLRKLVCGSADGSSPRLSAFRFLFPLS